MKQLVRQKLESQQGASILMALFLFLVCAVLAAVILAAGTASAGRVAGLATADQKYYSVSSATELFRSMMGGDEGVSVEVVCKKSTPVSGGGSGGSATCAIDAIPLDEAGGADLSITQLAAKNLVQASGSDVWNWQPGKASAALSLPDLKLSHATAPLGVGQVVITESLQPNGDIVVRIASDATDNAYVMQLTCKAQFKTRTEATVVKDAGGAMTRKETKTMTITWKATDLKRADSTEDSQEEGA